MRKFLKRLITVSVGVLAVALVAFGVAYTRSHNNCAQDISPAGETMMAVVHCEYGPPSMLKMARIAKPVPSDSQLLIRVHSAAVNPLDWHEMRGKPYFMRLSTGLRVPEEIRLGADFAGTVESVGGQVRGFKPGDEVMGIRTGALAEYVTVNEDRGVVLKPVNLSFDQAAAVGVAAITALQGLRDAGKLHAGQKVLINGASGGVGTYAVQVAKTMGAEVTGVSSTRNLELVTALGADHMVDYTKEDFTTSAARYDVVFDLVGNRTVSELRSVLTPTGVLVLSGGGSPDENPWFGPIGGMLKAVVMSKFVSQQLVPFLAQTTKSDLSVLADLLQEQKIIPVIDRTFAFSESISAVEYLEKGRSRGKVVVIVDSTGHAAVSGAPH